MFPHQVMIYYHQCHFNQKMCHIREIVIFTDTGVVNGKNNPEWSRGSNKKEYRAHCKGTKANSSQQAKNPVSTSQLFVIFQIIVTYTILCKKIENTK